MIYLKTIKLKFQILKLLTVLFLSNALLGTNYNPFQTQTSNTKLLLLDSWSVVTDINKSAKIVNIPYFLTDKNIKYVEFSRSFSISDTIKYSKVRIWILGLHGHAFIYLNDSLLKEHINLPTSYYIDIDPKFLSKENNIFNIKLNNFNDNGKSLDLRYPNYAKQFRPLGIAREIYLEFLPQKYLDKIDIKYENKNIFLKYELNITDSLKSIKERTVKVEEELISPAGTIVFKRFEYYENKISKKSIERQVKLKFPNEWNIESPELYKLRLTIKSGTDNYFELERKVGLRIIKSLGSNLVINDIPIKIKGINYRFNFSNGKNYLKQSLNDLNTIKEMGFNSVRFINYPPHPSIASFADSIGLYLFVDNGLWRLPSSYYANNKYFNEGKTIIREIGESFTFHPSVIGIGIGNEPNVFLSNEKKFTIVLKKYLSDNFNFLTYISPLNYSVNSPNKLCDLMLMQNYVNPKKLFAFAQESRFSNTPIILGNINFPESTNSYSISESYRLNKLKNFFVHYDSLNVFNGYFVDSFNDWYGEIPNLYTLNTENNNYIYPFGIVDLNGAKKEKFHFFSDYLKNTKIEISNYKRDHKNNFQSLIVFIIAIVFFTIYKRSYRLKENLIRSIQHPYGFFVDLRDRRIISVFNSTLMGITIGTIVASFLSSIIYAFHTSILFDEYINIFIPNIQNKIFFLSILESPWKLFIIIFIALSFIQLIFSFLLKIIGLFSKEKRKFRQIYSIISWSGSPLLIFIPIALFAYNFAVNDIFYPEIVWIFILFIIWYNFRIANGFRVLYLIQPAKMIALVFLTYLFLIISFLVYINVDIELFDYIKTLSAAQNLY